ncbi:MAG: integrin alpha [Sumerlaeia bacterium]
MNNLSGNSVSGAGDVNGDGLADVIVGAPNAAANGIENSGESYVIFSTATPPIIVTYRARAKAGNAPRQAIGISGDGSNDSTPDSRVFIDFADGSNISTQTVKLTRNNASINNLPDAANVMWEISTDRIDWSSAEITLRYTDAEITGLNEAELMLYTAPDPTGPWEPVTQLVKEPQRNQLSGTVTAFGYFALSTSQPAPNTSQWIFY